MLEPSDVRFKKGTQIRNTVFQHRQTVNADAEGKPLILVRVNTAGAQNVRMNHTAAQNLQPVGSGTDFQFGLALFTADIHFCRRLGKRKV